MLVKVISHAIDINQHLLVELGGKETPPPKDYTETFLLLKNLNVLPRFIEEIAQSAGFKRMRQIRATAGDGRIIKDQC